MKKFIVILGVLSLTLSTSVYAYQYCLQSNLDYDGAFVGAKIYIEDMFGKRLVGQVVNVSKYNEGCISYNLRISNFGTSPSTVKSLASGEKSKVVYEITGSYGYGENTLNPATCSASYPSRWGLPHTTKAIVNADKSRGNLNCQIVEIKKG